MNYLYAAITKQIRFRALSRRSCVATLPFIAKLFGTFCISLFLMRSLAKATEKSDLHSGKIVILDTGALESSSDYTASSELMEIKTGVNLGVNKARASYPECKVEIISDSMIKIENQGAFQKRVVEMRESALANSQRKDLLVTVGFSRSSNAKTVAQILKDSPYYGISVGAAAELQFINKRFFSTAYSLPDQWKRTKSIFKDLECQTVHGYFPRTNSYSHTLYDHFLNDKVGPIVKKGDSLKGEYGKSDCAYLGGNFSDTERALVSIIKNTNIKKIIGPGDWPLSKAELTLLLSRSEREVVIYAPSGWPQNGYAENQKAKALELAAATQGISRPTAILAYSYDVGLASIHLICSGKSLVDVVKSRSFQSDAIRNYSGISEGGNFIGDFFLHEFRSKVPLKNTRSK